MISDILVLGACLVAFWVACRFVLGPTITLLLETVQKLIREGGLVAVASIDFLKGVVWPATILIFAIVVLPYMMRVAMGLWCLQSWKTQQRDLQDRVAGEVKNVEETSESMRQEYQARIRHLEDQKQNHITAKIGEVRRIREKYEARKQKIAEECNVSAMEQQLAAKPEMTSLQAFSLGMQCARLEATKDQRLSREEESLKEEIQHAEDACKQLHENVDSAFQRFEGDQFQQRAKLEERLFKLQDESKQLRAQLPGHFRFIVGESARLCDQSLCEVQRALAAVKDTVNEHRALAAVEDESD